jgi:hypothetical protein
MNRIPLAAAVIAVAMLVAPAQSAMAAPVHTAAVAKYQNCTKLHYKYPHGVGKSGAHDHVTSGKPVKNFKVSTALYNANKRLDRDKDNVACEAH